MHLVCRNNNFDVIYEEHESIQNDIENGFVRWADQSYFNQWERLMLAKYVGYQPKDEPMDNWDNEPSLFEQEEESCFTLLKRFGVVNVGYTLDFPFCLIDLFRKLRVIFWLLPW